MAFGLTPTGFVRKTFEDIRDEIIADCRARIDPNVDTETETPFGQLIEIVSEKLAQVWEQLEAVNAGQDPDAATGAALVAVAALTGTKPAGAERGTVTLRLNLNAGVTVPAGAIAQVVNQPENRWVTVADATNGGGSPANISVQAQAEQPGAFPANAGTITVIVTPQSGWNSVTNLADAIAGTEADTDSQLRVRREAELQISEAGPIDAIREHVSKVEGVSEVIVFQNVTDATVDTIPPHAIEVVVEGGVDADLRTAIFESAGGGINTHGSTSGTVEDAVGALHTIRFTRPTIVNVYLELDLVVDGDFPVDGDALVEAALVAWQEANMPIGADVVVSKLAIPVFGACPGIVDIDAIRLGTAPSPVGTSNLPITSRQRADFDVSRITIAHV